MGAPSGGGRGGTLSKPMSVQQIAQEAQNFDYDPQIPLKTWLRSAKTLLKEAEIYEHEGNDQQTYLLRFRHAQLVLGHLSHVPNIHPTDRGELEKAERAVKDGLEKMETIKPRIQKRYERYEKLLKDRAAMGIGADAPDAPRKQSTTSLSDIYSPLIASPLKKDKHIQADPALSGNNEAIAAGDHRDLAVELAHQELKRRAVARKATRRAGIPEEVEQERRTAGVWGNWEKEFASNHSGVDGEVLSQQMQNIRLKVDEKEALISPSRASFVRPVSQSSFQYPTIPSKSPDTGRSRSLRADPFEKGLVERLSMPPPPPPKDYPDPRSPPPRPEKQPIAELEAPIAAQPSTVSNQKDLHPSTFTFKPSAYLENGTPLRTIFLPPDLRHRFTSVAEPNTRANLETCGILCGTLISNALFISRLVIPEQISTSDTCETINETAFFDYVDGEDLMVLGWIHTHPTQTCFMSSRDLHTHSGYQVMMPESIAIVCAPSKAESWGIFRLTDPPGMKAILNCRQTGLFHPHAEKNVYTEALRPGHVFEAKGLQFEVHDMRTSASGATASKP